MVARMEIGCRVEMCVLWCGMANLRLIQGPHGGRPKSGILAAKRVKAGRNGVVCASELDEEPDDVEPNEVRQEGLGERGT
jgi:hypothetical protein